MLDKLRFGTSQVLRRGDPAGVVIIAAGICVDAALDAADTLSAEGIDAGVVNARFIRPLDVDLLDELSLMRRALVTVEEHSLAGGFGSAVLEALADKQRRARVIRLGIPETFVGHASQAAQRAQCGLDKTGIANAVREACGDRAGATL